MIGIVILNYNTWDETYKSILSVFDSEVDEGYYIYLIDNDSKVPMPQYISDLLKHPQIKYIRSEKNLGYSGGNNIGVKIALEEGCDEILIANNDIVFKKDSILKMKQYLRENKNVGIVGPKVYLPDGSIQEINCGIKMGKKEKYMYLLKKTPLKFLVKDFVKKFNALDKDLSKPFIVYAVSGCCFMMSRQCALKITPFDEETFLYEEENIIGVRMENLGYSTVYCTDIEIVHEHGQSTKHMKAFSYSCFVESELYYFKKYLKGSLIEVFPLYTIRTLKYLLHCLDKRDYRKNVPNYFSKTLRRLFRTY